MSGQAIRDTFRSMSAAGDQWHCELCHRVVSTADTNDPAQADLMLEAHREFNCAAPVRAPWLGDAA